MRVLVTGGAGFIGTHIVAALVAAGDDVVVLDSASDSAHRTRPEEAFDEVEYRWADVRDPQACRAALAGVDALCHQASKVGLGVDFGDVVDYVDHNDLGTAQVLGAAHDRGFDGRIVLASSMVVYGEGRYSCPTHGDQRPPVRRIGDLDAGRFDPRCPRCGDALASRAIDETSVVDPRNIYAATKLHQEHLVNAYANEHGSETIALRYHNVYGPGMPRDTPYAGVAAIFRSAVESGHAPAVFEDGGQMRDFVHVADVARANVVALHATGVTGAFNVASGHPHTVGEMATALAAAAGGPPPEVTGRYRIGDVRHVFASPAKATAQLGFTATVGFADGMREFATAPLRS